MRPKSNEVLALLRAVYSVETGVRPPSKNFFDALQTHYSLVDATPSKNEMSRVLKVVKSIASAARTFEQVSAGKWPESKQAKVSSWDRDRLKRIVGTIRHKASVPLLLAASQELPPKALSEVVRTLELFLFRYVTICSGHPSSLGDALFAEAHAVHISGEEYDVASLRERLAQLQAADANDAKFKANLPEVLRYTKSNSLVIRHFLTTLEDFKGDRWRAGAPPSFDTSYTFDLDQLDVEHVHAQTPLVSDSDLDHLTHEIGNLTFWHPDDNRGAKNASFTTKRQLYKKSKIRMTRELGENSEWDAKAVLDRQARLVSQAMKVWNIT
jgi:hypothetical protein